MIIWNSQLFHWLHYFVPDDKQVNLGCAHSSVCVFFFFENTYNSVCIFNPFMCVCVFFVVPEVSPMVCRWEMTGCSTITSRWNFIFKYYIFYVSLIFICAALNGGTTQSTRKKKHTTKKNKREKSINYSHFCQLCYNSASCFRPVHHINKSNVVCHVINKYSRNNSSLWDYVCWRGWRVREDFEHYHCSKKKKLFFKLLKTWLETWLDSTQTLFLF